MVVGRLRGENGYLFVLPTFGHPSSADRKYLPADLASPFFLSFRILENSTNSRVLLSHRSCTFGIRGERMLFPRVRSGFVRTDIFFESFCVNRKKTTIERRGIERRRAGKIDGWKRGNAAGGPWKESDTRPRTRWTRTAVGQIICFFGKNDGKGDTRERWSG